MPASDAPTRELGRAAVGTGSPYWDDLTEHVPELKYPYSVTMYAKMRQDPTIRSLLLAYTLPIRSAPWHVEQRGASLAATRVAAESFGLPVLGDDPKNEGAVATRGVQWDEHLRLALMSLVFGHMPFEPIYDVSSGTAYLSALPERMPYSLLGIDTDDAGRLKAIRQAPKDGSSRDVVIPAARLLFYVHDREGAAWQGQSMLRSCYGPWIFKQESMRGQASSLRRFGQGIPIAEPLPGFNPTPAQITEATRMVAAMRGGDRAGAVTPGFRVRIVGVEGTLPDHMPFLAYLDQQMARAALTSVLDLGNTTNGSRALGSVFLDLLVLAMQSVAQNLAATASVVARRLTDFNEGPDAEAPVVAVGDVGSSRQTLARSVADLVEAGALSMDDALEAWVRDAFDLPARDAPRPVPPTNAPPPLPPGPPADDDAEPAPVRAAYTARGAATGQDWPYRRQLTALEAKSAVDPLALDEAHARIVGEVLAAWPNIAAVQFDELERQVREALESGALTDLGALSVTPGAAITVLVQALRDAYEAGVETATAEAQQQGAGDLTVPEADDDQLSATAVVTAMFMARSLEAAASREALRRAGTGATADEVAAGVRDHLESLSLAYVRDTVGGAVGGGINGGRAATFRVAPRATYYASEVRDGNTCPRCLDVDGRAFADLTAAEAAYPTGGYLDCDGGLRCRGVIFAIYEESAA